LGCDTFEIKICACPGRDLTSEEKKHGGDEKQILNIKNKEIKTNVKEDIKEKPTNKVENPTQSS
jgi:hypothetical protein